MRRGSALDLRRSRALALGLTGDGHPAMAPSAAVGGACRYLDLLSLFQGMDEQRRETINHIEFESKNWYYAFQLTLQLTRTIPMVGWSFRVDDYRASVAVVEAGESMGDASQPATDALGIHRLEPPGARPSRAARVRLRRRS